MTHYRYSRRSDRYQHLYCELPYDFQSEIVRDCWEFEPPEKEEIADRRKELREALLARLVSHCIPQLTQRQQQIVLARLSGEMQIDTARRLGIAQTTISHSFRGCHWTLSKGRTVRGSRRTGGIVKRLIALAEKDPEIQRILGEIASLDD
jgi:hypothetical protein